ncbi:MAG: Ig-like domain-containing protein, partial [Candidatus Thermoplasmatota archaeon]|nr:Ig-like domain-containing protein [Candidatus Thermoplasmatota archaeon]
ITELQRSEEGVGTGVVHLFELPLGSSLLTLDDAHEMNMAPAGITDLGMDLLNIGDQDGNGYPEILFFGWNATNKLMFIRADNSPSPSRLWIDNPKRHAVVSGDVEIRARIFDIDGDAGPENIRFYRSSDNRSWSPIGDGRPDRIEGDTAIKDWPTRLYENTGYFFKVQSTDGFGLTTVLYTDRVDVMNHAPPFVDLVFPRDNAELRGIEDISARITLPSDEELQPPVRFFYSRDNSTWTEFANSSSPSGGSEIDHVVHLDTEDLEDGPIWFRVNATTLFGLGREDRNLEPALINNFYPPQVNLTFPIANTTIEGFVNVTANVSDPDDDLKEPVTFNIKSTDEGLYDLVANMTAIGNGTYFYNWDTTSVVNGWYDLMVLAKDTTFMQSTGLLNSSIYIRNRYSPSATLIRPEPGDVLSGLSILRATVTDKDLNFRVRDIVFEYSNAGENIWTSMDRPILKGSSAEVTWDTTAIMNGLYDIRVSVTDDDDLTSVSRVDGVRVKNPFEPVIMPDLPRFTDPISGVVRLSFNVSDDEPLPPGSVKVEVKYIGTWIELEGLVRATTGGTFTPGSNISYYIDWDTAKIDEVGSRVFPDGVGYDVRITVTDSDNLISVFVPSYSYEVKNKQESTDDDVDGNDFGLSGFAIALIALGAILLLVFIFLFFIMRSGRNKEKDVPLFDTSRMQKEKPTPPPDEEATPEAGDMYSPGGWGAPEPAQAVPLDDTMFSAGSDIGDLGLDLGVTEEKDLSDISDPFFPKEKKAVKRTVAKPVIDLEDEVEVDLPEGVMPSGSEDEVDEWDDEGDEWEDEDDWEELEEDDWEELEEDGSGDPSDIQDEDLEDDEDVFIVTCKCGEEIEIPSDFKGSKFRCPECGKKGRIPER